MTAGSRGKGADEHTASVFDPERGMALSDNALVSPGVQHLFTAQAGDSPGYGTVGWYPINIRVYKAGSTPAGSSTLMGKGGDIWL